MKRFSKISAGLVIFLTLNALCRGLTGDFDSRKLLRPGGEDLQGIVLPDTPPSPEIRSALRQRFRYLGKGHQAFAFVSEDGQYVLKLFRSRLPPSSPALALLNSLKIPGSEILYGYLWKDLYKKTVLQSFASYSNGYTLFRKESLIEYVHLKKTGYFTEPIRLFDKIGVLRNQDPDASCFLLQKRIEPLEITLDRLLKQGSRGEIRSLFTGLVDLLARRSSLGFYQPTHKFGVNFGCIGSTPFQLDVGNLVRHGDPGVPDSALSCDLDFSVEKLKKWVRKRFPPLESDLEEVLEARRKEQRGNLR